MNIENVSCRMCGVVYEVNTDDIDGEDYICERCYDEEEQAAYLECLRSNTRGTRRHDGGAES